MFVILTSRPGQYRTEAGDGLEPCETYEYLFCGQPKAQFVIAALLKDVKIRLVDTAPPQQINEIPCKFLQKFATIEAARAHLQGLTKFGGLNAALSKLP